jgi:VWFA-related protein
MKPLATLALLLTQALIAQTPAPPAPNNDAPQTSTITVNSTLVVVPALVKTKSGELVYTLKADDFTLTDDGVPQKLRLDEDTGSQPLALVICVQTGGDGASHFQDYRNLSALLDNLLGAVDHKIAIVGFDAKPILLHGFTPNTDFIETSLNDLDAGDPGDPATHDAAILDAVTYSVDILRQQPTTYRRAILLFSETVDHGSHTTLTDALRAISDTNTSIYSIGFNSTRAGTRHEFSKLGSAASPPLPPGPTKGCFSRDFGTDADGNPIPPPDSKALQNFDCFAELLPPLRLAKMAEIAFGNSLRKNVSASVARLTGGEFYKFSNVKQLQHDLLTIANHVPNRYTLSFHPLNPIPGFHTINLTLKDYPQLRVEARNGYWVEAPSAAP